MSTVEEIEEAIARLSMEEYLRFVEWFRVCEATRWDEQMDRDCSSGRLDSLFAEAESERENGVVHN